MAREVGQTVAVAVDLPVSTVAQVRHTLTRDVGLDNEWTGSDNLSQISADAPRLVELCPAFGQRRGQFMFWDNRQGRDQSQQEAGRALGDELKAPVIQLPIADRPAIDDQRIPHTGLHTVRKDRVQREEDVVGIQWAT